VGNGGLLGTWGCLSVLGLADDAGRRASIARGAVWLVIGAAVGLVGMGGQGTTGAVVRAQGAASRFGGVTARLDGA
jgi:hypothetical protein